MRSRRWFCASHLHRKDKQQVALFGIVMGVALLLTGTGLLVLTLGVLRRAGADGRLLGRPAPTGAER